MGSTSDAQNQKLKLLACLALDDTAALVGEIVQEQCAPKAVAVLMWDPDLESFGEKFTFGEAKKELAKLVDAFAGAAEAPAEAISQVEPEEFKITLTHELEPALCYRLEHEGNLVACLLIAGTEADEKELVNRLSEFPFSAALNNAWQYSELRSENERLRSQYESMEDMVSILEDQTRKLIHDITVRDSIRVSEDLIRTRQMERDRLVFSISNMVRSSINIQRVLQMAAEQIGTTFATTRCLILRAVETSEQLNVVEYTQPPGEPVSSLFFSESGLNFAQQALQRSIPHEIDAVDNNNRADYDPEFLQQLGLRSGLLVPLILRERILGVMFLQHCTDAREWSIDDVSLIGSLADNLSIAIENAELHQDKERQAVTDGLTGIANRRSFNETFTREFERARRYGEPLSLVMIDLDFLKKINDNFGHQVGDEAIKAVGQLLRQSSRTVDLPARYGGEEFCLLLPNTEIDMAEQLADRLRRLIDECEIEGPGRISASIGVASYPLHADEPDELFLRADEALYAAKDSGRNRVCVAKRVTVETSKDAGDATPGGSSPGTQSSKLLT